MVIILLGPPGSGKGTQSSMLVEALKAFHISTGAILRQELASKTSIGIEIETTIKSGKLVSDELINKIIEKRLNEIDLNNRIVILDGYPRNIGQAEFLKNSFNCNLKVIYLKLSDEEIIKRLSGRFSCPTCQRIYNKYFDNPLVEGECDNCGKVEFNIRQDDNAETIINRLGEYRKETEPLIAYYSSKGLLSELYSNKDKEELCHEILKLVKKA
ncbi:MAG: adenylate kinase [Rickettsiaceae bacterium]|jgi:adenylate kinase|nr:adenylate kinase [Rickettsiaceae bacterium]